MYEGECGANLIQSSVEPSGRHIDKVGEVKLYGAATVKLPASLSNFLDSALYSTYCCVNLDFWPEELHFEC